MLKNNVFPNKFPQIKLIAKVDSLKIPRKKYVILPLDSDFKVREQ